MTACFAPGVEGLLAPLQEFLDDELVSEILINRPQEVFVEKADSMLRIEMPALTSLYLRRLFLLIANENKQTLSDTKPLLSGNLPDGSRVQLVIPSASKYETLSIRKFTLKHLSFEDYEHEGFFNPSVRINKEDSLLELYHDKQWPLFLKEAILAKKNILISGATTSGKTTFLNSCARLIPRHERLITLEDTFEIKVPHANCVNLKAVKPIGEASPSVTMQDLVQASCRLRPDRILMGEIRGREVFDFVSACLTGHNGMLATIHASDSKTAFMRMAQLYKLNNVSGMSEADIYQVLHQVIDVVVQLDKTSHGRQMTELYYKGVSHV
jgi:type IV secretion system protein VirB11